MATLGEMRDDFALLMHQTETDLAAAHEVICKLQGLDPKTHTWPEWSSPANTLRWIADLRKKHEIKP